MRAHKSTAALWEIAHKKGSWATDHDYPTANAIAFLRYHVHPYAKERKNVNLNFLDVGCGSGANTIYFGEFGYNVFAIDCSETAIAKTKKRMRLTLGEECGHVKAEIGKFDELQFKDNYFDAILSDGVFYYGNSNTFISAVNESFRVLKNNGILRVYTKSDRDFMAIKDNKISNDTFLIKGGYEKGMTLYCPPKESILKIFSHFSKVSVGIEQFNYIETFNIKSYWVITAVK